MLRLLQRNLVKGVGLGLFLATGFSAWVTFLRLAFGTEAFDRLHTTYGAVVRLYYTGGLSGGILLGLLWPLRRWPLGSVLLGIIGVFPVYYGAFLLESPRAEWFTFNNFTPALLLAFLVGSPVGLLYWLRQNPHGPVWIDVLRYPTPANAVKVSVLGVIVAGLSWFGLSKWTAGWPMELVILVTFLLFILPIGLVILVTVRAVRLRGRGR
jgi:hypothetical protein